ncbi:MAG TPA: hypothetical protein VGE07_22055, partial [Herpetosiphonaceae bacterium]
MVSKPLRMLLTLTMVITLLSSQFVQLAQRASAAPDQVDITVLNTPYTQNFDTLANTGTTNPWVNNTTIVGWESSRTVYIASNGSSNTGALYSNGSTGATERALGSIPSNTSGAIYYGVRLRNATGQAITSLDVSYTGEQWRDGGNTT